MLSVGLLAHCDDRLDLRRVALYAVFAVVEAVFVLATAVLLSPLLRADIFDHYTLFLC